MNTSAHANKLDLSHKNLQTIPAELYEESALKELWLDDNQILQIPEEIRYLSTLKRFSIYKNQLDSLDVLCHMIQLERINASVNKLSYLPEQIGNLKKLQVLDLNYNQISELPDSVGYLLDLRFILLASNRLNSLPHLLHNLTSLIYLNISFNCFSTIAEWIGRTASSEQSINCSTSVFKKISKTKRNLCNEQQNNASSFFFRRMRKPSEAHVGK
jgi:Leucine-rich repeat (LRR) protein